MSMTSTICRSVINTRDVIKNKNITTLLETLSLETGFTNEKIVKLSQLINGSIDEQFSGLIDRIQGISENAQEANNTPKRNTRRRKK